MFADEAAPVEHDSLDSLGSLGSLDSVGEGRNYPQVNARYRHDDHLTPKHVPVRDAAQGASETHWEDHWDASDLQSATEKHVMLSWGPSGPAKDLPHIVRGEGVYLYDSHGKEYLDWTSQAVCSNFGHTVPQAVIDSVVKQMETVAYMYSGMGMVEVRSRLSQLMAEICPGDINGFLFPCTGAEANEAAVRIARRYTGRQKILTQYRSYHGGTAQTLGATGDFRRAYTEQGVSGFVKIFNPQPMGFTWGQTDEEASTFALKALEEQIINEGPDSIAAIMLESIVGAGGVLVPPCGYMEGVRALCDSYGILLMLDEVMAGFGRTGEFWAFEHFDGVIPDIFTSAKGLTGAYMPMSMVAVREPIRQWFLDEPLGWGSTYHAHPVSMACAYECVKHMLDQELCARVQSLESIMLEEIQKLIDTHPSVKQGRAIGLFGCIDLQGSDGRAFNRLGTNPTFLQPFRKALKDNGLIALFRPPMLHCCPPLTITETELRDGFQRLSTALKVLDETIVGVTSADI